MKEFATKPTGSFKSYERPIPDIDAIANGIRARCREFLKAASESGIDEDFLREFENMADCLVRSKYDAYSMDMRSRYIEAMNDRLIEASAAAFALRPMSPAFVPSSKAEVESGQ